MSLTTADRDFLARRAKLIRHWPVTAVVLFGLLIGLAIWLLLTAPLLINPLHVNDALAHNQIELPTLTMMAAMLPLMTIAVLVVMAFVCAMGVVTMRNEKRYHAIIRANQ